MRALRPTLTLFALLTLTATACGGTAATDAGATPDTGSSPVDAGSTTPDMGTSLVDSGGTTPDASTPTDGGPVPDTGIAVCTGQIYDPCNPDVSAFCASGNCHAFPEFTACTQPCSASSPCPDQAGVAVTCNAMGLCRPDVPNGCREL